jgi:hypothetical protein
MTGHSVQVRPVVLFPKWWVDERSGQPHVWVLNDTRLFTYLKNEPRKLSNEDVSLYIESLETYLTRD